MYKSRMYGNKAEVVYVHGKFACAFIEKTEVQGYFKGTDLYFVHEGELHVCTNIYHDFFGMEVELFKSGEALKLLASYGYTYEPCSTAQFLEDFREVLRKQKCHQIELRTDDDTVLTHYKKLGYIHVTKRIPKVTVPILLYSAGKINYCPGTGPEPMFEGYPDMDDSSICMNFMLAMGNVQYLKDCVQLFDLYMKHKNV